MTKLTQAQIDRAVDFHGHMCPGLTLGLRAAEWVLEHLGSALDEEIVCVTECDMCAVDAIQSLVGCSFGKGNLIYRDYGKVAFTFWRRQDGKAYRLVNISNLMTREESDEARALKALAFSGQPMTPEQKARHAALRQAQIERLLNAPLEEVYKVEAIDTPAPVQARIMASVTCACCGEAVMESRARLLGGKTYCIPCFKRLDDR